MCVRTHEREFTGQMRMLSEFKAPIVTQSLIRATRKSIENEQKRPVQLRLISGFPNG